MLLTNKYVGRCFNCGAEVKPGAGTAKKMDGRWRTFCSEHRPDDTPRVTVVWHEQGTVLNPQGFLGDMMFGRYRKIMETHATSFDRALGTKCPLDVLPLVMRALETEGFVVVLAPEVKSALGS